MSAIVKFTGNHTEVIASGDWLEALAEAVNREGNALEVDQQSMLARAFRIGDLLNEAKVRGKETGTIPHGEFGKWCDERITIKAMQYQRYMRLARETPKASREMYLTAGESIRTVYATLAGPGDELDEKKAYWTIDEWNKLPERHRSRIIDAATHAEAGRTFNRQDLPEHESMGNIEWARWSWNPVTGCKHDCPYCYARDIAERFFEPKFEPAFWPDRLAMPRFTKVPDSASREIAWRNVFSNSMSDLYGRWVPNEWINATLSSMRDSPQWNFLMLTKFPKKAAEFAYSPNCWIGASVDMQARVRPTEEAFERVECGTKWLSLEPLIEPLKFSRPELFNWVVIGGASKSSQTPEWTPPAAWTIRVAAQFLEHGIPVYLKTNGRPREYPGVITPQNADSVFHYLKRI